MVELAGLYSNTFRRIVNAKKSAPQEAEIVEKRKNIDDRVKNERGEVEVKRYRQRQIILSEKGRKEVVRLYLEGCKHLYYHQNIRLSPQYGKQDP